ncbi:uncharacterized protein J3D65DRAFT_671952 [Phyllosticta citribraziliensis]|uniref:Rhodopsin domain-containing protein n=1 Tax=Phyllosticta citribraziliensis TaxID=989973 RepID=A0ABR1L4M4_9PEZI
MEFAPSARRCLSVVILISILAFVVLVLKVGTRLRMRRIGWDDNFALLSFIASVPTTAVVSMQAEHGMGYHSDTLSPDDLRKQALYFWLSIWLYIIALGFAKLSILAQYLRIFIGRRTTIVTKLFMWIVAVYSIQGLCVTIFQCHPVHYFWDRSGKGRCFEIEPYYYVFGGFNIFLGLAIVVIPVPALNELRLPLSQKLGLLGVFILGGFACAMSIVRLYAVVIAMRSGDPGYANSMPAMWSMVELHVCLMCGCLPSLRPLLAQFFTRPGSSNSRSTRRRSTPLNKSLFTPTPLPHIDESPEAEGQELQGQVLQFDHLDSPIESDGKPLEQKNLLTYVREAKLEFSDYCAAWPADI